MLFVPQSMTTFFNGGEISISLACQKNSFYLIPTGAKIDEFVSTKIFQYAIILHETYHK